MVEYSLQKIAELKPDVVLPGHGPYGNPDRYVAAGIQAGVATGWGKIPPENPDPFYGLQSKNYLVVGWNESATSAPDFDTDSVNGTAGPLSVVNPLS